MFFSLIRFAVMFDQVGNMAVIIRSTDTEIRKIPSSFRACRCAHEIAGRPAIPDVQEAPAVFPFIEILQHFTIALYLCQLYVIDLSTNFFVS
jgi:hypothetical protein